MSAHGWMPVLCVLFILFISSHAQVCDYTATIKQLDYISGYDMAFRCSYNATVATMVRWMSLRTSNGTVTVDYRIIYTAYLTAGHQHTSFAAEGYETKLETLEEASAHELIIKKMSMAENFIILRCAVYTVECENGVAVNYQPAFADPQFGAVAMLIDGKVRTAEYETDGPVDVTCFAQSAPKAEVSIKNVSTPQTCERLAGDSRTLWNCSVSVTLPEGERDVRCRVEWYSAMQLSYVVRIRALSVTTPEASNGTTGAEVIDWEKAQALEAATKKSLIVAAVIIALIFPAAVGLGVYLHRKTKAKGKEEDKGSLTPAPNATPPN